MFVHLDPHPVLSQPCTTTMVGNSRYYKFGDQDEFSYPSITTVLSYNPEKKKGLAAWRSRIGEDNARKIVNNSSKRGTSLHSICERYIDNYEGYIEGAMPDAREMFLSLKPHLDSNLNGIVCQEQFLYSHTLKLAGRTDLIAYWGSDLAVLDFKNSIKPKREEWLSDYYKQLSGYAAMYYDMTGQIIKKGVVLIAVEGQRDPQIFITNPWRWIESLYEDIKTYSLLQEKIKQ